MRLLYAIASFLIISVNVGERLAAETIKLDGTWQVKLIECFAAEVECRKQLSELNAQKIESSKITEVKPELSNKAFSVEVPSNLRRYFPWFHGYAEYTKEFDGFKLPENSEDSDLLILGSIGSIDRVYLNDKFIGFEGNYEQGMILPVWNKVRAYHIPSGILRKNKNIIRVGIWVTDVKAGIHAGPLMLGNSRTLIPRLYIQRLLREYIFNAIPFLLFIVMVLILITFPYWQPEEGHVYLLLAFAGYFVHSLYYAGIPWPWEHLTFLKIHWSGRLVSAWLTIPYFLRNFGIRNKNHEIFILVLLVAMILITFTAKNYSEFFQIALYLQGIMFIQPLYPVFFHSLITEEKRKKLFRSYLFLLLPVTMAYINDFMIRLYLINSWWVYHYLSILNIINFLYHYAYHLYLWRDFGQAQGRRTAEVKYLREKLNMANELHDLVGSELSQAVVLSQNGVKGGSNTLHDLVASSLEKVRSFARILKNEEQIGDLSLIFRRIYQRLDSLQRFQLKLCENDSVYFNHTEIQPLQLKNSHQKTVQLSEYSRIQIDRILSEWIANIIRHAKPDKIILGYRYYNRRVTIFIFQSKKPFTWDGKAKLGGLGSLARRAHEIQGYVKCVPRHNGAVFILKVPGIKE